MLVKGGGDELVSLFAAEMSLTAEISLTDGGEKS